MRVITRAEWGAIDAPLGARMVAKALSVTAHHSFSPALPASASEITERETMRGIQRYHVDDRHWLNIGYNFVIAQSGRVYEGRGWNRVGAHAGTKTGNRTSIGVCFLIDGTKDEPSTDALASFYELRRAGEEGGQLRVGHELKLHRDWKDTDCPGDVAAAVLRERNGIDGKPRLLERGDRGEDVRKLQKRLGMPERYQTGYYGSITLAAVRLFQQQHGLEVDGLVGRDTRAALNL